MPKERTKNKRAHSVPLTPLALTITNSVQQRVGRDHLFGEHSRTGFTKWGKDKRKLDDRVAGQMTGSFRTHDIRRSVATRMADPGIQPHIIEAALNHYSGHGRGFAGVYNRSPYEREVRNALVRWSDHVESIVGGGERKVLAFPHAAQETAFDANCLYSKSLMQRYPQPFERPLTSFRQRHVESVL